MTTEKLIAFVRLLAPLVSAALALVGVTVDADSVLVGLVCVVALVTFVWAWWKNNNITTAAQEAQKVLDVKKEK